MRVNYPDATDRPTDTKGLYGLARKKTDVGAQGREGGSIQYGRVKQRIVESSYSGAEEVGEDGLRDCWWESDRRKQMCIVGRPAG